MAVPNEPPVTTPVVAFTEAIPTLLLDHVPPGVPWLSEVVEPIQVVNEPTIGPGDVTTFMVCITVQPAKR